MWRTSNSLYASCRAVVAVPAGSATITAPEEAAAVSVHWRRYKPATGR
jgi:hypothetical protein